MKHPVSMGSLNKPCRIRERIYNSDTLLRKDDFATMINTWIQDHVAGLSCCDIGGIGLSSKNERISTALNAGATRATMIDARKDDFWEWAVFKEKMDEQHLQGYDMIAGADLEDPRFPKSIPRYDFVHCTGILYHLPSPVRGMENLYRTAKTYLIANTVIVPEKIENEAGSLEYHGSEAIFGPGLTERERKVLYRHYQDNLGWPPDKFDKYVPAPDDEHAPMPWRQFKAGFRGALWKQPGDLSYSPYWWLFTPDAFRSLARVFGLKILDEYWQSNHALTLFCQNV